MRGLLVFLPAVLLAQAPAAPAPEPEPKSGAGTVLATDDQKTVYSLGLSIERSLAQLDLSPAEIELVKQGIADAATGKPALDLNTWGPKFQAFGKERGARVAEREKAASAGYLAKAAAEPGATKTDSGMIYREVTAGAGNAPKATDTVKVNYRGTLVNGTEFDSSYKHNAPAQFALNQVIPCWTEGVQKMKTGGKAVLLCPSSLVFEIELLDIAAAPAPAPVPGH